MTKKVLLVGPKSERAAMTLGQKHPTYTLYFQSTFAEAIELAKLYDFDIVILDALIGAADGRDFALLLAGQKLENRQAFIIHPTPVCKIQSQSRSVDWNIELCALAYYPFAVWAKSETDIVLK